MVLVRSKLLVLVLIVQSIPLFVILVALLGAAGSKAGGVRVGEAAARAAHQFSTEARLEFREVAGDFFALRGELRAIGQLSRNGIEELRADWVLLEADARVEARRVSAWFEAR